MAASVLDDKLLDEDVAEAALESMANGPVGYPVQVT